jgi:hypothetical protein
MTTDNRSEPIAPGAALQDPALQQALHARAERRHWWSRSTQAIYDSVDLPILRHLLGSFPWQICDYRNGRWEWVEHDLEVIWWHTWARRYDTVQLLDHTGRSFAELTSLPPTRCRRPAGGSGSPATRRSPSPTCTTAHHWTRSAWPSPPR